MKILICFCLLSVACVSMSSIKGYPNGCIYIEGRCFEECEDGTYGYTTGCGYITNEPTCKEPYPVEDKRGQICDYSACYCNPPTVRDEKTNKCVKLEDCPKQ